MRRISLVFGFYDRVSKEKGWEVARPIARHEREHYGALHEAWNSYAYTTRSAAREAAESAAKLVAWMDAAELLPSRAWKGAGWPSSAPNFGEKRLWRAANRAFVVTILPDDTASLNGARDWATEANWEMEVLPARLGWRQQGFWPPLIMASPYIRAGAPIPPIAARLRQNMPLASDIVRDAVDSDCAQAARS